MSPPVTPPITAPATMPGGPATAPMAAPSTMPEAAPSRLGRRQKSIPVGVMAESCGDMGSSLWYEYV